LKIGPLADAAITPTVSENDLKCVEWDVKPYYTILYPTKSKHSSVATR